MRASLHWPCAAALALAACGTPHRGDGPDATVGDDGGNTDGMPARVGRWAIITVDHPIGHSVINVPFDGTGFREPCLTRSQGTPSRDLIAHPSRPYVYGVDSRLEGLAVGCDAVVPAVLPNIGAHRDLQRIVLDPAGDVGFFTIDGPGNTAVYRFTTGDDGVPTLAEAAQGATISGALVLDAEAGHLFVGGQSVISDYPLDGAELHLSNTNVTVGGCDEPVDLVTDGPYVLEFCGDEPAIRRYARAPFAFDSPGGAIGATDRVLRLPHDRAIAARRVPPQLALISLGAGTPTWIDGPVLGSRVKTMAVSADGNFVVTSIALDANTSELALWSLRDDNLRLVSTRPVTDDVTAISLMTSY